MIPVLVHGGTGYVAGELLRLLIAHPEFRVAAIISSSQAGQPVIDSFPHLAGTPAESLRFESHEALGNYLFAQSPVGLFAATPHGATAALIDRSLGLAERSGAPLRVVDLSADFRFPSADQYASVYGHAHGAPHRLDAFFCSVPEQLRSKPPMHAVQPGCFTTAVVLAAHPFFALGLVRDDVFVAAITGSSGSGRKLGQGTHHPERSNNLFAYGVLSHRHEPEMRRLLGLARDGIDPEVQFVAHSGPFVRGIHATLRMTLQHEASADDLVNRVNAFYGEGSFIQATVPSPKLSEVIGTNRCRLGIAVRGRTLVVTSVIDNLVKGSAGGAVQWMNRLFDLPDDAGLRLAGLGWY